MTVVTTVVNDAKRTGKAKGVLHAISGHKPGNVKTEYHGDWKPGNWNQKSMHVARTGPSNRFVHPKVTVEHTYLRHGQKARTYKYPLADRRLKEGTKSAIALGSTTGVVGGTLGAAAYADHRSKPKRRVKKSMSAFGVDHG